MIAEYERFLRPTFIYDAAVTSRPLPYSLRVDEQRVSLFFNLAGIPDHQAANTTISFLKELPEDADEDDYAAYSHRERKIEVYIDPFWHEYRKCKVLANEVIRGNKAIKSDDFNYLLAGNTERTINYLASAPFKRAKSFIDRLLLRALTREINSALLHEIQHARDHHWISQLNFLDEIFNLVRVGRLWNAVDPLEKRAERFENKMIAKAMERPMVVITPA